MEELDLVGVGRLEPEFRDEYDDVILAVISGILSDSMADIPDWVARIYSVPAVEENDAIVRATLNRVEEAIRCARLPVNSRE